jgi:hypothetical protein
MRWPLPIAAASTGDGLPAGWTTLLGHLPGGRRHPSFRIIQSCSGAAEVCFSRTDRLLRFFRARPGAGGDLLRVGRTVGELLGADRGVPGVFVRLALPVLAEKIVTAIDRGEQHTRGRDFVDISAITGTRTIRQSDLTNAITTVAAYREVRLRLPADVLEMLAISRGDWLIRNRSFPMRPGHG